MHGFAEPLQGHEAATQTSLAESSPRGVASTVANDTPTNGEPEYLTAYLPDTVDPSDYSNPDAVKYVLGQPARRWHERSENGLLGLHTTILMAVVGHTYRTVLEQLRGGRFRRPGRRETYRELPEVIERFNSYSTGGRWFNGESIIESRPYAKAIRLTDRFRDIRLRTHKIEGNVASRLRCWSERREQYQRQQFDAWAESGRHGLARMGDVLQSVRVSIREWDSNSCKHIDMAPCGPGTAGEGDRCWNRQAGRQRVSVRNLQTVVDARRGNDPDWFEFRVHNNLTAVRRINRGMAWLDTHRDATGRRLFHLILRLPRELRYFLTLGGERNLVDVDIRSSQIWCHVALFQELAIGSDNLFQLIGIPELAHIQHSVKQRDVDAFAAVVEGDIYQLLADAHGEPELRDEWKTAFIAMLYDKRHGGYRDSERGNRAIRAYAWFRLHHPSLCAAVDAWKRLKSCSIRPLVSGSHAISCAAAQRVESLAMIDFAADQLLRRVACIPLHDGILVAESHRSLVESMMREGFERIGLRLPDSALKCTRQRDSRAAVIERMRELRTGSGR